MTAKTRIEPRVFLGLILFTLFFFREDLAISQNQQKVGYIYVTQFGVEQGLSQSMVSRIIQDNRGLIWMATGDGLNCFNGEDFRVFKVPVAAGPVRSDQTMRELIIDSDGKMLVSTSSSIYSFNSENGKFNLIGQKPGQYPFLIHANIKGKELCWWPETGYQIIDSDHQKPIRIIFEGGDLTSLKSNPNSALRLPDGTLLISTNKGILELQISMKNNEIVYKGKWFALNYGCQSLTLSKSGKVFCLSGSKILQYINGSGIVHVLDINPITGINLFADSKDNLWISDRSHRKLYKVADRHLEEVVLLTTEGKLIDTIAPSVKNIFEDKDGNIWFGTDGEGALLYSPDLLMFSSAAVGFTRCITRIGEFIYAGTFHNGLWKMKHDLSGAIRLNPVLFSNDLYFLDLTADSRGRLWIATSTQLFVLDGAGNLVFRKAMKTDNAKFLVSRNKQVLLSTDSYILNFSDDEQPAFIGQVFYPFLSAIITVNGWYWIGYPYGLYKIPAVPVWPEIQLFEKRKEIISKPVFSILKADSLVWIASENGLVYYNSEGGNVPLPDQLRGLQNEILYCLGRDAFQRIWFSGNKGIGCISSDLQRVVMFGIANNLQSLEFNYNAFYQDDKGQMYFGGINGLNSINPSLFKPDRKAPQARLFSLMVSDAEYSHGIPAGYIDLELDRTKAHISGKVFSTNYIRTEMQEFSFFLEGYQDEWSKPSSNSLFTYRNLPPGEYQLWVKCWDSNKNEGAPICLIKILIKPPFWKTWWFLILLSLTVITITVMIVRKIQEIRFGNKLRELEYQNAINKERLRISKDMHDEIGASLTRISILSELGKKHIQEPPKAVQIVQQINEIAGSVVDEMSEIIWAINPKNDNLPSFASYFRHYASTYLESAEITGKFNFADLLPTVKMTAELRRNIFLTCKEALHNLVKHSSADMVSVSLDYTGGELRIEIRDNGKGFDIHSLSESGNGLINMQKRIDESGGKFTLKSTPGEGTGIHFSIPLTDKESY